MYKRIATSVLIILITLVSVTLSTQAAFMAKTTVSGIHFSTGHAALNIFANLAYTNAGNNGNLTATLPGTGFTGIGPNWSEQYLLKYMNTGSVALDTSLRAVVQEDTGDLAAHIWVEAYLWDDANGNGAYEEVEMLTAVGTKQTIASLVDTPFPFGLLPVQQPRGIRFLFTTQDLPTQTQSKKIVVDFVIDGTTAIATPAPSPIPAP